jgi:hypothetical protein
MSFIGIILKNKQNQKLVGIIFVQQLVVALGTFLLGKIASEAVSGQIGFLEIIGLIISISTSGSIFSYWITVLSALSQREVILTYLVTYAKTNYNQPQIWRNKDEYNKRHDMMIREAQESLTNLNYFLLDVYTTSLNIVLNTISVVLVTHSISGLIIFGSGFVGFLIIYLADKKITKASEEEIYSLNKLTGFLQNSWDNIVIGNKHFYDRWTKNLFQINKEIEGSVLKSSKIRGFSTGLASFVTSFLVIIGFLSLAYLNLANTSFVVATLVILPRSMQLVLHIQILQSHLVQWKHLKSKVKVSEETFQNVSQYNLKNYIKFSDLKINSDGDKIIDTPPAPIILQKQKVGRFTVRGENGSGKSAFLLQLKKQLGEEAVYIPANHKLDLNMDTRSFSSGELSMTCLNEIRNTNHSVFLLDEWDANLSPENRQIYSEKINEMAKTALVLEVRHG